MPPTSRATLIVLGLLATTAVAATAQQAELPRTYVGKPTTAAISPADLMTRLYAFADDSMMGREVGTVYHLKATAYIEREVRRLGLAPAGDDGGYFQNLPVFRYFADSASRLVVEERPVKPGDDFLPYANAERTIVLHGTAVVYGGSLTDSATWISADQAAGHVVMFTVPATSTPARNFQFSAHSRFGRTSLVLVSGLERIAPAVRPYLAERTVFVNGDDPFAGPATAFISTPVAKALFEGLTDLAPGAVGKAINGRIIMHRSQAPARNVVAILPGSDAALKGQYVAVGAHSDHIGFEHSAVDHDSVRVFNMLARPHGGDSPLTNRLRPEQLSRFHAMMDSLRALHPARADSIYNGADDDGTGTVSALEIAEALVHERTRPKRSILFVWHAGEEKGLWGSEFFTEHPTVPRDSIVAQLNMDMIGRGGTADVTGATTTGEPTHGGPGYLQLIGSRRLSTELGDLIEGVNARHDPPLVFDYAMDANGHPQNIYCRSDHYEYARHGIPIVFMTTGGHSDYHQVTDEPQYIDYAHMAQVANFARDVAVEIANLDHRIPVNKVKPDPNGRCVQ
ncbi:MAG: M28 family peptidase [bacterium]